MQDNPAPVLPGMPLPPRPTCGEPGCDKKLYRDNQSGYCGTHRYRKVRPSVDRFCSLGDCDRKLHPRAKSGFCSEHAPTHSPAAIKREEERLAEKAERDSRRQTCTADGCTKLLYFSNKSGRCYEHKWITVSADDRGRCPIEDCGKRLSPKNTIGRCEKHALPRWVAADCAEEGCTKMLNVTNTTGYCGKHNQSYRRAGQLWRSYGITPEEYAAMLAEQDGKCYLCGKPPKAGTKGPSGTLHVDHEHATGTVRRLLCTNCNRGIGFFKENPDLMRAAAAYVEAFRLVVAA